MIAGDFFLVPPIGRYDAVIGNPPYVRYQDFAGEARARSREAALRAGVPLTRLASSWAAFTVHSALFLKPGGCSDRQANRRQLPGATSGPASN